MPYREVTVVEIKEVLRLWLRGSGIRPIARLSQLDRKTVRRYVDAATASGLSPGEGEDRLTDEVIGEVCARIHGSERALSPGRSWRVCEENREALSELVAEGLRLTKILALLERKTGEVIPYRTLHRFATSELGFGKAKATVRVADGSPGEELQVDFGRMGLMADETGKRRAVWALVFTAVYSRHQFVHVSWRQSLPDVIEGFERAWEFFGGVFRVVVIDNMKAVVTKADACSPRLNDRFREYSQARGFVIDAARVRTPTDKPRVERQVPYVRESLFRGEQFRDLGDLQRRAEAWCRREAGTRIHGTTRRRPAEVFEAEERKALREAPSSRWEIPSWAEVTVGRDHHVTVCQALYSVPTAYIGECVRARADRALVKVFHRGQLIKTHPRKPPGGRSTDPNDYPAEKAIYAMRDSAALARLAAQSGRGIGLYAERILEGDLPWTRMRHVYRLLGLVRRYGADRVETACNKALELDVIDVTRVARMLDRALERPSPLPPEASKAAASTSRFERNRAEFRIARQAEETPHGE